MLVSNQLVCDFIFVLNETLLYGFVLSLFFCNRNLMHKSKYFNNDINT